MTSNITEVILNMLNTKYRHHKPYDINGGLCGEFALDVIDRIENEDVCVLINDEIIHAWVYCDGKHYDAETPNGVNGWRELPLAKRNLK